MAGRLTAPSNDYQLFVRAQEHYAYCGRQRGGDGDWQRGRVLDKPSLSSDTRKLTAVTECQVLPPSTPCPLPRPCCRLAQLSVTSSCSCPNGPIYIALAGVCPVCQLINVIFTLILKYLTGVSLHLNRIWSIQSGGRRL